MPPAVSFIVPTFDRLKYLRGAIESAQAQTFEDWELVIADDGSDDETRAYLASLRGDPRVKLCWLRHSGVPATVRNAALRAAVGDYVAFLDSDDLWAAKKTEAQLARLRERPKAGWCYSAFVNTDAHGAPLATERNRRWAPWEGDIFERVVTTEAAIRTPCVLAARDLVIRAGGFDEAVRSGEDYDLWMRLALSSPVAVVDEPLVQVRRHDENYSGDWSKAFVGRDHTLTKLQGMVTSDRKALLRRERAKNGSKLVATHAALGSYGQSLSAARRSLPYSWSEPVWWLEVAKTVARPLVPLRLRSLLRDRDRDRERTPTRANA